tara:strand:+ start:931 stop:1542 length:612 start_codon:yes stop_codon:yes gene_type:complete
VSSNKRKHSNLLLKLKYLYAKIDYQQELFEEAKKEFEEYAKKFCDEHDIDIKEDNLLCSNVTSLDICREQIHKPLNLDQQSKHIKSLFKKIAVRTHPDKLTKLSDEEKERKTKLFLKAQTAAESDQWFVMLEIAQELGIKTPELDDEQVDLLNQESASIKTGIDNIEGTYAWAFYNEKNERRREKLMIVYLKNFGIDLTKDIN